MNRVSKELEYGAVTIFFSAVILPLLLFTFSLSMDISAYLKASGDYQQAIDDAALYSFKFLPFEHEARVAAERFLRQSGIGDSATVSVDSSGVSISLVTQVDIFLASYFGIDAGIPVSLFSRAKGTPFDVFVALDASGYTAPNPLADAPWGSVVAQLFQTSEYRFFDNGQEIPAALISEQCFNPVLSELKRGAIRTYEALATYPMNALSVAVFPGSGSFAIDTVRSLSPGGRRADVAGEADFTSYVGIFGSDVLCAASAERESYLAHELGMPSAIEGGGPNQIVDILNDELDPASLPYISTAQVLWSQVARVGRVGNFSSLLQKMQSTLLSGEHSSLKRGGLQGQALKTAFIFAGDIPWVNGERFPDGSSLRSLQNDLDALSQVAELYRVYLKINYILFEHGENIDGFESRLENLRELSLSQSNEFVKLEIYKTSEPEDVALELLSSLLLERKRAVLSR